MEKNNFFTKEILEFLAAESCINIDDDNNISIHLRMFYDLRHSWLEVPLLLLALLNCKPEDFTKFSYLDTDHARMYLEEDLDIGVFYERLSKVPSEENPLMDVLNVSVASHGKLSSIRELPRNIKGGSVH
jgi:hypothetical protein